MSEYSSSSDTNGDSTFEFLGEKDANNGQGQSGLQPKDATSSAPSSSGSPLWPTQPPPASAFQMDRPQAPSEVNVALVKQMVQLGTSAEAGLKGKPRLRENELPHESQTPTKSQLESQPMLIPTPAPPAPFVAPASTQAMPTAGSEVTTSPDVVPNALPTSWPRPERREIPGLDDVSLSPTQLSSSPSSREDLNGLLGWIAGNEFLNKVAEKAKNSVDSMITTLDPGMKEYLYSGGAVSVIVASDKESKVGPIREAFFDVFGRATVKGVSSQPSSVASQPVGYSAALKAVEERIANIRTNLKDSIPQNQVIVALENFVVQLSEDSWFDLGCLLLDDPLNGISLTVYTQAVPVPNECVNQMKFETPNDYPFRDSGFSLTIGAVMAQKLGVAPEDWHEVHAGVSRGRMVQVAARVLAHLYKNKSTR